VYDFVADEPDAGITFSPDGTYAYVTETGANQGFNGWNFSLPSSMQVSPHPCEDAKLTYPRYRFTVLADGTWENRKTFAYIDSGVPDGNLSPAWTPTRTSNANKIL